MKKNKLGQFNKTVLISALLIEITTGAQAATIDVDGVTCTFNDAVTAANLDTATGGCTAGSGADVLELPADTTLTLTGVSDVNSDVTINGNGSTLDAAGADRVLRVGQSNYGGAGDLTINDTTISNGYSINNNGTDVANFGAGVRAYNGSTLIISNSTISNNNGGGVMFSASNGGVYNSVIKDNVSGNGFYGAGLSISASSVIVSNSTISANNDELASGGGGIYVTNYGGAANLQIMNSTISGNKTLNNGGGIHHVDYGNVTNISLTNVTLVNNTSTGDGGGLSNDAATITISQSLISGNTGTGGSEINSSGGTVTADDYNLFGLNATSGVVGVTVGASDVVPTETTMTEIIDVTLADNGGMTMTHALNPSGPAVDMVPNGSCASMEDQTGKMRPIDGNVDGTADCDIGAFENENPDIIFKDGFE